MFVATSREMQNIDRRAAEEFGIPPLLLMENAALGVVRLVEEMYGPVKGKKIALVCGKGNNGGDGLAAARQLYNRGARIQVYLLSEQAALKGDAAVNLDIALKIGIELYSRDKYDMEALRISLNHSHVIIDAILGTGLSSLVTGEYGEVIGLIHDSRRPVAASIMT